MPSEKYVIHTPTGEEEHAAGGVVYRHTPAGLEVLVIERRRYADWSLPKGHLERGETLEAAALREVEEETGVAGRIVAPLGAIRYPITGRSGRPTTKVVTHFLIAPLDPAVEPIIQPGETDTVRWAPLAEAARLFRHAGDREILAAAATILAAHGTNTANEGASGQ
jgi:8-oxo-dGTP diphosphatase